jgi:rod shape-determining protein MreD
VTRPMSTLRWAAAILLVSLALILQVTLFAAFSWQGVVPDLVLLVVVAAALAEGGQFGIILGFIGGLLLDVVPPVDHTAGRWALALLVVGYVAGRVRQGIVDRVTPATALATAAACSFVGTSVFALTGLLLHDQEGSFGHVLAVVAASLAWDVVLTPVVLPAVMALLRRIEPERGLA